LQFQSAKVLILYVITNEFERNGTIRPVFTAIRPIEREKREFLDTTLFAFIQKSVTLAEKLQKV